MSSGKMSLKVRTKTQNVGYVSTKWWRQQDRTWRHVETYLKTYATKPCNGCQSGLVLMLGDRIIFLIFIHLLVICPCVLFGCIPIVADRKKFLLRLSQIPAPWQHQWESFQSQCHAWSMIDGFALLLDPESWIPVLDCLQVDQYRSHQCLCQSCRCRQLFWNGHVHERTPVSLSWSGEDRWAVSIPSQDLIHGKKVRPILF